MTMAIKKFNAIILKWVVRRTDHDAHTGVGVDEALAAGMGEQALGRDVQEARLTPGELAVVDQCHDVAGLDFTHAERAKPVFDALEVA